MDQGRRGRAKRIEKPVLSGRAVFLDRDGTINQDGQYISRPEMFFLVPGAGVAIRRLNEAGFSVVVVTNQAGVARGLYAEEDIVAVNRRMEEALAQSGAHLDAVYYCPHHPEFGGPIYRMDCPWRKPEPGMLFEAAREHILDLLHSYMIGDSWRDIGAGRAAGCRTILVLTGQGREHLEILEQEGPSPDHIADDLPAAVDWIIEREDEEANR